MNKFNVAILLAKLIKLNAMQVIEEDENAAEFTIMIDKKKFTISVRDAE